MIATVDVEVLGHGGPEVGDIVVGHLETGEVQLVDGPTEQLGVEGSDAVHHQGETAGVSHLVGELALANLAVPGEVHLVSQALERLALVQLAPHPAPEIGLLEVAQDEERLDQPAILLQGSGKGVPARVGLELGEHERRQHRPLVDGGPEAQQIIPVLDDAAAVDPVADQASDVAGHDGVVDVPQALVGEVTDARRERQADQVIGSEQQVGEAGGVGGVLGDRKLGVAVAQGEDLVEGEETLPDPGGNHPGPEGGVNVRSPR